MGRYVVDFFCATRQLVIEIDGGVHRDDDAIVRDAARQAWLERSFAVRFLRFDAALVESDLRAVLTRIRRALE